MFTILFVVLVILTYIDFLSPIRLTLFVVLFIVVWNNM